MEGFYQYHLIRGQKGANTRGSNLGKGLQSRSIQSHDYAKENFGGGYVVAYVL